MDAARASRGRGDRLAQEDPAEQDHQVLPFLLAEHEVTVLAVSGIRTELGAEDADVDVSAELAPPQPEMRHGATPAGSMSTKQSVHDWPLPLDHVRRFGCPAATHARTST